MRRSALLILIITSLTALSIAQEMLYNLGFNPELYYKTRKFQSDNQKLYVSGKYLFILDTLDLPFYDDFSKNRLRRYDLTPFIIDTINRSAGEGANNLIFEYMFDTSWTYVYDTVNHKVDSFPKNPVTFILNNDSVNPLIPTDFITGWPVYYTYTFDSSGRKLDSTKVEADSVINYGIFYVVRETKSLWLENQVFLNSNLPVNALSLGVATFDGLNPYGLPYGNGIGENAYGGADTLTSKPIDLRGLSVADSLYLSFFYEPQGYGDYPDPPDSLILEFLKSNGQWKKMWSTGGFSSPLSDPEFKIVMIPLKNQQFFYGGFQFRFRNYASKSGNNDLWHIDYVLLDKNRTKQDTAMADVAVYAPSLPILANYVEMPWNQFQGFESTELAPEFSMFFINNYHFAQNFTYRYSVEEEMTGTQLFTSLPLSFNLNGNTRQSVVFQTADFTPIDTFTPVNDSLIFSTHTFVTAPVNDITSNDTFSRQHRFFNFLAYDDGTAEKGYGLQGPGLKKFAYEFHLNRPDTLRAVQIHFTRINIDPSNILFSLFVWGNIDKNNTGATEDTLYYKHFLTPRYTGFRDGFATYVLDTPVIVSGMFYIGWQQVDEGNIQVGFDMNNVANDHMFYNINGIWYPSQFPGAVMIRPVLGKNVPLINTGVKPVFPAMKPPSLKIFPNPAVNACMVSCPDMARLKVYTITGSLIRDYSCQSNCQIILEHLNEGIYLMEALDDKGISIQRGKLIVMNR